MFSFIRIFYKYNITRDTVCIFTGIKISIESATLTINYDLQNQTDYNDYQKYLIIFRYIISVKNVP